MCLCCSAFRRTLTLSVLVSLPSSPSQSVLEYVSRISKFKWKCYYKVCWAGRLKAEHSALMMFWSLTSHYLFKEKIANICLAKNMFSPSTNTSHSSRVTFLGLFPEPSFRSTYGKLDCKIWGCVVLSDNLKGSGRRSSLMIRSGENGWMRHVSKCFVFCLCSNHAVQAAFINREWNWTICLLQYSKPCISIQKC